MSVLKDMVDKDFTVGDYVLFSTGKGMRLAKVRGIRDSKWGGGSKRVAVEIVKTKSHWTRVGAKYSVDYSPGHFFKVNPQEVDEELDKP